MYILLILFIFILFAILCQDVIPESYKDFIDKTETNKANKEIPNYKNNLFINPRKFKDLISSKLDSKKKSYKGMQSEEEYNQFTTDRLELEEKSDDYNQLDRLDQKQNSYEGIQPKDLFFDIFNINCTESVEKPWSCLLIKGNTVNNISRDNCKKVCPDKFKKLDSKQEEIESFKNIEDPPSPSHYYCYSSCKQSCIKNKYNPLEPHKNSCGQNAISQMPLDVYLSEDDCMKKSFPCKNLSKDECLGKSECGWCTNGIGEGQCFPSTPDGPLNLKIPCTPSRQEPNNSFIPGRLNPFVGVGQIF